MHSHSASTQFPPFSTDVEQASLIVEAATNGAVDPTQRAVVEYCESAYFSQGGRLMHNTLHWREQMDNAGDGNVSAPTESV